MTTPEHVDPFRPPIPRHYELGRLVTHGTLAPDWLCRLCRSHLAATPGGALVCLHCDYDPKDAK